MTTLLNISYHYVLILFTFNGILNFLKLHYYHFKERGIIALFYHMCECLAMSQLFGIASKDNRILSYTDSQMHL